MVCNAVIAHFPCCSTMYNVHVCLCVCMSALTPCMFKCWEPDLTGISCSRHILYWTWWHIKNWNFKIKQQWKRGKTIEWNSSFSWDLLPHCLIRETPFCALISLSFGQEYERKPQCPIINCWLALCVQCTLWRSSSSSTSVCILYGLKSIEIWDKI